MDKREKLFRYIWGILKNRDCQLYRINAMEDHVHLLLFLHPSISLADLVRDIKSNASKWIKENKVFISYDGWQKGYSAFTHSVKDKSRLIEYIKNQEEHHKTITFIDEYKSLLKDAGIEYEEKYLF